MIKFPPNFVKASPQFIWLISQTLIVNRSSPSFGSNADPLALWSGYELSHLLDAAIALFVRLAQRWETAGHAPAQMHQARQATLPKSGKSENGSIFV